MGRFLGWLKALAMLASASLPVLSVIGPTEALAQQHQSFLRIAETTNGNARQITLGLNKSMIVELPREVREVVVSNPEQIDAVLQTSKRAYLIGRKT
jgi:pilus assembly protein CpaC